MIYIYIYSLFQFTSPNCADLAAVITWMPHGRAWKILNRDLFAQFALPRYFGHQNHASFVRIINAWGFRRISSGVDRDAYYHEVRLHFLFISYLFIPVLYLTETNLFMILLINDSAFPPW